MIKITVKADRNRDFDVDNSIYYCCQQWQVPQTSNVCLKQHFYHMSSVKIVQLHRNNNSVKNVYRVLLSEPFTTYRNNFRKLGALEVSSAV